MNEEENKCIDKECMICFEEVNIKIRPYKML